MTNIIVGYKNGFFDKIDNITIIDAFK